MFQLNKLTIKKNSDFEELEIKNENNQIDNITVSKRPSVLSMQRLIKVSLSVRCDSHSLIVILILQPWNLDSYYN